MSATPGSINAQSQREPAELEREIQQQRRHIEDIVQALESKLSPGEMFERALSFSKGSGREFVGNLGTTVRQNPMPALLTAAGIAWLYASSRQPAGGMSGGSLSTSFDTEASSGSHGMSERMHAAKSAIGDKAHGAADTIRGGARKATESVRNGARSATGAVRGGVTRASDGYGTMLRENPLAAGAIAVAVGAVFGALIPPTRKEDELLGETRDRLLEQARTKAREQKDAVVERARDMAQPGGGEGQAQSQQSQQREDDVPTTASMGGGASTSGGNGAPGIYGAH